MRASLIMVVLPVAISLASCTPSRSDTDSSSSQAPSGPLRQLNPSPRRGYRIRLTIQDAPGPLVLTDATAQYDVVNEVKCGEDSPYGGVYRMTSSEAMSLQKVDDATYEGVIYLDQILNDDYYGNGICEWQLTRVSATLLATGGAGETRFAPSLSEESIRAQGSEERYFWRGRYPRAGMSDYVDFGDLDRSEVGREFQDQLFRMKFEAKKVERMP